MKKITHYLFIISIVYFTSCSKEDKDVFNGSQSSLEDLFSEEVVQTLNDLNFTINEGANPPNLEGTFYVSQFILTNSNVPQDNIGSRFADQRYTFLNQNNSDNTIDFNGVQINVSTKEEFSQLDGSGSFISGEGNRFSIFLVVEQERINSGTKTLTAFAISGSISEGGIVEFEQSLVMLDNFGDPKNEYIENGQGRKFIDQDEFSEIVTENNNANKNFISSSISRGILSE
ncbi:MULTISPECIES: hypothetical protein [Flavobacteriaceae]|uniref:hypothetical protein n=1 Tax=Flavobacteriaceae TaxID=49546 RepID=UPI001491FF68|nr:MULTISPECIES: hypothetical protein [Allomuricauda]MDC6366661.1 hypothetical protein [Muricauda sp. AC10]